MRNLRITRNRAMPRPAVKASNRRRMLGRRGLSLIELVVAAAASIIVVLGVGFVLADSNRAWHKAYEKAHGDVVVDGFVARRMFDSVIRSASSTGYILSDLGDWLEVQYYSDISAIEPDRYARFKRVGSSIQMEVGSIALAVVLNTRMICGNVTGCTFKVIGSGAQMILDLDDGVLSTTVVAGGFMHN